MWTSDDSTSFSVNILRIIMKNIRIEEKMSQLQSDIIEMKHHQVFNEIKTINDLRIFMEWHIFTVWDFRPLIQSLKNDFTGTTLSLMPTKNTKFARLINEIALGEESDETSDGSPASHLQIYLSAMHEVNTSTSTINDFIYHLKRHVELDPGSYGPATQKIIGEVTGGNEENIICLLDAALVAVRARISLWNELEKFLLEKNLNVSPTMNKNILHNASIS